MGGILDPSVFAEMTWPYFITFNYDRSLEYFILKTIKASYGLDDNLAARIVKSRLNVKHVYGSFGTLPELKRGDADEVCVPFGDTSDLAKAAQGIKIVYENQRKNWIDRIEPLFQSLMTMTADNTVVISGLAYLPENCEQLYLKKRTGKTYAGMYGIDDDAHYIKTELGYSRVALGLGRGYE